ncbi:hypothetical protein pipiens_006978 [Culex pipiens pipiens]|uniref:Uncharacterized protein n=2 Tax=Culex pipiens TaxID=7175 RepID=A0ABD1DML0_CULPP
MKILTSFVATKLTSSDEPTTNDAVERRNITPSSAEAILHLATVTDRVTVLPAVGGSRLSGDNAGGSDGYPDDERNRREQHLAVQQHLDSHHLRIFQTSSKMKVAICLLALVAVAVAAPQERDGAALTNEAIRQAQSQQLIPRDATIQGVQEGIQVAAIESIPGDQRVDLFQLLGDQVPREVITNLQSQVDQVGHN